VATRTTFRICQKGEVLFVGVRAGYDPKNPPREPPGNTKVRDGDLWQGEEIELFLDLDNADTPGYYQLALTAQGVTGDWFNPEPKDPEARWDPPYQVKVHWTPQEWTAEFALPLTMFDRTRTLYQNFGLNVCRVWQGTACWAAPRSEGFHFPHRFGEVRGLQGANVKANPPGRFRSPYLKVSDRVIQARASPSLVRPPAVLRGPEIRSGPDGFTVRVAVAAFTDIAVWVEDEKGERIRHLAAGLLGPNPPPPLQPNSLEQALTWDGRDDQGRKVPAGKYRVQVGAGSRAALERVLGQDVTPKNIQGIAVDDKGQIHVVSGIRDEWCEVQRFDRGGQNARMLYPPPARIPPEKLKGLNILDFGPDGQVRFGSHRSAAYLPHLDQPMPHTPLVNRQGQVILFGGEYLGGPTRFYKINADGSLPDDFLGPYVKEFTWQQYFAEWAKRFHFALDPSDENRIVLSGLKELHRAEYGDEGKLGRETYYNAICRVHWGREAPLEVFAGKKNHHGREGSKEPGEFFDPQGIAFDAAGNLWVCDRGNDRLQVLDRQGKFLRQLPHPAPYEVRISRKTGAVYVLGADAGKVTLTKYTGGDRPTRVGEPLILGMPLKGHDVRFNMYYWTMALDDSGDQPELKVVRGDRTDAYQIDRIADLGDRFAAAQRVVGQQPPREYKRLAVSWNDEVIWAGGWWLDANTGELLGKHHEGEVAAARDGRWLTYGGFWPEAVSVYPAAWARDARVQPQHHWRLDPAALSRAGSRGFCVAPDGDVYVARYYQWQHQASGRGGMEGPDLHVTIDHYAADGKLKRRRVVYELSHAAAGPAVDIKGNIYVTDNVGRKLGQLYEDDLAANLPAWVPRYEFDWEKLRKGEPIAVGYEKFVYNPLIKSVGTLYKFGPEGGGLIWRAAQGEYVQHQAEPDPKGPFGGKYLDWGYPSTPKPNRPATHWSAAWVGPDRLAGMYPRWQEGVQWEFLGVSPVWGRYDKGHSSCCCNNSRLCVDDFGRTYVPAAHRNTVRMIDTAGNEILRIGRYGNMDATGPDIPLLFPAATALSKRHLYITEWRHARVLKVKLGYEKQESREVHVD
jgi:hypothetical protein